MEICKINFVKGLFIAVFLVGCSQVDDYKKDLLQKEIKKLDIEIISPSSGIGIDDWCRVFKLTGKSTEINTASSEEQVFINPIKKFALLDKAIRSNHKILWAIRGGYGLDKIMPYIVKTDYSKVPKKIIVSYSDTTSLQVYFSQKYGWKNISACTFKEIAKLEKTMESREKIINYLIGKENQLILSALNPLNLQARQAKGIEGKTIGGNMSIIQTSIGTKWQFCGDDKIIFLEDTDVHGYKLDRILMHLDNAGVIKGAKAIIFGFFNSQDIEIISNFAKNSSIPVFQTNNFGHDQINMPIGYNFESKLLKEKNSTSFQLVMK